MGNILTAPHHVTPMLLLACVYSSAGFGNVCLRRMAFVFSAAPKLVSWNMRAKSGLASGCMSTFMSNAPGVAQGTKKVEGADAHWDNFITGRWGDFHGRFCRYEPTSSNLMVQTHLLRSYHVHGSGSGLFLRQDNKIFFGDERGTVARGPWDVTKEACNTERGIVHPRVGDGETGTTFLVTSGSARATAWAVHQIEKTNPLRSPGVVPLGKGHESEGYMVEMLLSHGDYLRMSLGFVYDQKSGKLQHISFNREDARGFPSGYWSGETLMTGVREEDIEVILGLKMHRVKEMRGSGHQIEIPVKAERAERLQQLQLANVDWTAHLTTRKQENTGVFNLPDGVVVLAPRAIPFGEKWSAAYLWKPHDSHLVHSLETRYMSCGAFDCFRHLEFSI